MKKLIGKYLIIAVSGIVFSFVLAGVAGAVDLEDQKQELEKIRKEMEDSKRNLDSLKNAEKRVLKDISEYEQKASMNKTVLNRLNNQLRSLRKDIDKSKNILDSSEEHYSSSRNRYLSNLKYYYSGIRPDGPVLSDEISKEKDAFRKMLYLKALAEYDKEELGRQGIY